MREQRHSGERISTHDGEVHAENLPVTNEMDNER